MAQSSDCKTLKLIVDMDKESMDSILAELNDGISDLIEYPINSVPRLKAELAAAKKASEKSQLRSKIKQEQLRFVEHKKLFKHLVDKTKEYLENVPLFVTPQQFVEERINYIQGIFQTSYFASTFRNRKDIDISGLNDSANWDAGKIRYIRRRIEGYEKEASKALKGLSAYENSMKAPLLVAATQDPTGNAFKTVQMSQSTLDTYLERGFKWKDEVISVAGEKPQLNLGSINRALHSLISKALVPGLTNGQAVLAIEKFFDELIHGEARNIIPRSIPTNTKDFVKWRNSWVGKTFFSMLGSESERHVIGDTGAKYILVPMHTQPQDKKGRTALKLYRKIQIKEGVLGKEYDPGEHENAYFAFRIPDDVTGFFRDIRKNRNLTEEKLKQHLPHHGLDEGFYTAQTHQVYTNEMIEGTSMPKRKYTDFKYGVEANDEIVYQPPAEWTNEIWDILEMQREWSDDFFKKVMKKEYSNVLEEFNIWYNQVEGQLARSGWNDEMITNAMTIVDNIGGPEFNLSKDKYGNFVGANTFIRKASRDKWGHVKFYDLVYKRMVENTLKEIQELQIPELESYLENAQNLLDSDIADAGEKAEALEDVTQLTERIAFMNEMIGVMENKLYGDPTTEQGKKTMNISDRIMAAKGRTLFTDHKQRIKNRDLWNDYVDQAFRSISYTRLKIQLLKSILALKDNPSLNNYLIDQIRASTGHADIESKFLWINTSDEWVANHSPEGTNTEDIRDMGLNYRGWKTSMNLGSWTSLTNNFQRVSQIINYGMQPWYKAMMASHYGDLTHSAEELRAQVRETGVLEPFNAFIDMLSMGITSGQSHWGDFFLPYVDIIALKKNTTLKGWLSSSKGWDKMIARAAARGEDEKIEVEELRRIKTLLHGIVHGDEKDKVRLTRMFKDLKMGLTRRHINRLVKWKIDWFPVGIGKAIFTMKGSEEQMRTEAAVQGFYKADDLGRVRKPAKGKWKYTDSPEAIVMAKVYVYSNLFGFTKPMLPKMFRSAVSGTNLQWRQYDYNEMILEHEIMRAAALSGSLKGIGGWASLAPRMSYQIIKKMVRAPGLTSEKYREMTRFLKLNKALDDKNLDRATNLFLIRGLSSMTSVFLFYKFEPYTFFRALARLGRPVFKNPVTQRAMFGMESPWMSRILHALVLIGLLSGLNDADDEDAIEDILRDYFPGIVVSTYLWTMDLMENLYRGAQQYLPSPLKEVAPFVDDAYEMIEEM